MRPGGGVKQLAGISLGESLVAGIANRLGQELLGLRMRLAKGVDAGQRSRRARDGCAIARPGRELGRRVSCRVSLMIAIVIGSGARSTLRAGVLCWLDIAVIRY
jgi:hypothetical protein